MNLDKMLKDQKKLDTTIFKNAGIKEYPLENIRLALLVELGELANEWKGFKYWKKDKKINREKLLDEFADCLHFALSLENYLKEKEIDKQGLEAAAELAEERQATDKDIIDGFEFTFSQVLDNDGVLGIVISLGLVLGITLYEMESCYYKKHKENYARQENGY